MAKVWYGLSGLAGLVAVVLLPPLTISSTVALILAGAAGVFMMSGVFAAHGWRER